MNSEKKYIRHGFSTVRLHLYGPLALADFVKHVFGAEERERVADGEGAYVELQIGDSLIGLFLNEMSNSDANSQWVRPTSAYVYVENVDEVYQRAIEAGATSIDEPKDKPYHERNAGIKDMFGNTWGISTYIG